MPSTATTPEPAPRGETRVRNIVILFDGTSNEIAADRSNVLRLYGTLAKTEDQVVYYDPGVGTFGAENSWSRTWRELTRAWGMATGLGIDDNVKEAYRFLVEHRAHDPRTEEDRICIFGFSRGAYTARVLAGFLHAFGLIETRNLNLLDYAYRAYKRVGSGMTPEAFGEIDLYKRILRPMRPTIRLLGLFDTVASVIEPGRFLPRIHNHVFTRINPSVQAVRHAVSIDERRTMFRPLLWPAGQRCRAGESSDEADMVQDHAEVWFAGSHGDVGGGYPEDESGLAKLTLQWMIEETQHMGLEYTERIVNSLVHGMHAHRTYCPPDPLAPAHDPLTLPWWMLEVLPQPKARHSTRPSVLGWTLPLAEPRYIPPGAVLHHTVPERGWLAPNVPDDYRLS